VGKAGCDSCHICVVEMAPEQRCVLSLPGVVSGVWGVVSGCCVMV
jgi:hypothetical protein